MDVEQPPAVSAEAVVVGEAEDIWPQVIDDARCGRLKPIYRSNSQPDLGQVRYDRTLFRGRRYLRLGLIETGRGCFACALGGPGRTTLFLLTGDGFSGEAIRRRTGAIETVDVAVAGAGLP